MNCLVKQVDIPASAAVNDTITVTDAAITSTPALVLFVAAGRSDTTDAVGSADSRRMFGAATSTSNRYCWTTASIDAGGSSDAGFSGLDGACIAVQDAGGDDGRADLDAMLSNGFRLIIKAQFGADIRVTALVIYGASAAAVIVSNTEPGTTGTQDITSSGFGTPTGAIFVTGHRLTAWSPSQASLVDGSGISIGAVDSAGNEGVLWAASRDGRPTMETASYLFAGEVMVRSSLALAPVGRAEWSAWITDGVRINWLESNATALGFVILLKGGQTAVRTWQTRTDGNDIDVTVGFQATGGLVLSHCKAMSTQDTAQDHDEWSVGFWASTSSRAAHAMNDEDATANAEVATAIEHDAVYVNLDTADAVEGVMDVKAVGATTTTFVMDDTDPSAAGVIGLFFGAPAAGHPWRRRTNTLLRM